MNEKRNMFIEVSQVGNFKDGLAIAFSRYGDNGTWCGEEVKLVAIHAEKDCLSDLVDGLLDHGGDFRTMFWHRALIITEHRTIYIESENGGLNSHQLVNDAWTPDAINGNRNVYVTLVGLDPLRNDTHAVAIGMVMAAQRYGTPEAFFNAALMPPKKKSWYRRFLDWLD